MEIKQIESIANISSIATTPVTLPQDSICFWLDAGKLVNGTMSPTDGDKVHTWNDNGPLGKNFIQPTFVNQPIWKASGVNGLPYIKNTAPQWLYRSIDTLFTTYGTYSAYMIFRKTGTPATGGGCILMLNCGSYTVPGASYSYFFDNVNVVANPNSYIAHMYHAPLSHNYGLYNDKLTVLDIVKTSNSAKYSRGYSSQTLYSGVQSNTGVVSTIGSWLVPTRTTEGEFYEIIVYDKAHTPEEREQVHKYLKLKYAL